MLPFMGCGGQIMLPDAISANWGTITTSGAGAAGTNSDLAINFKVGANRYLRASANTASGASATLYYRINSGSWVSYLAITSGTVTNGGLITLTPGQTLGWRIVHASGAVGSSEVSVKDDARSESIDLFGWSHNSGP